MKRFTAVLIFVVVMVVGVTTSFASNLNFDELTLEELVEESDTIVRAFVHDDATEVMQMEVYGMTVSSLEIVEVYKGELHEGDVVKLVEPYWSMIIDGEKAHYVGESEYLASVPEKEYIFFLHNPSDDYWLPECYSPKFYWFGRYPVFDCEDLKGRTTDDLTSCELGLDQREKPQKYKEMLKEVMNKYLQ